MAAAACNHGRPGATGKQDQPGWGKSSEGGSAETECGITPAPDAYVLQEQV